MDSTDGDEFKVCQIDVPKHIIEQVKAEKLLQISFEDWCKENGWIHPSLSY